MIHENGISIKTATLSVTTTANGNGLLVDPSDSTAWNVSKRIVLFATIFYDTDKILIPYKYRNLGSDGIWGVHIMDCLAGLNALPGTYDVTVFYVDR